MCVPWHVPQDLREKASSFLCVLSTHTQLQPPRLSVLAITKLAKMQFGLERMIKMASLYEYIAIRHSYYKINIIVVYYYYCLTLHVWFRLILPILISPTKDQFVSFCLLQT